MEMPPEPPGMSQPPEPPLQPLPLKEERTWALAAHLSAFAVFFLPPFGHILGPLIIWLVKRDSSEFVEDQAKEALNAQISATIYSAFAAALIIVVIGVPLLFAILLADAILIIVAAVNANDGRRYRYPLILRLVK